MEHKNEVVLAGYLGSDPKLFHTEGKRAYAHANLGIKERYKSGESWREHTQWIRLNFFEEAVEQLNKACVAMGDLILVRGKIRSKRLIPQNGTPHILMVVVADHIERLEQSSSMREDHATMNQVANYV